MPTTPYLVYGTIYTSRGTVQNSMVRINSETQVLTNSKGQYILDLANMDDGWTADTSYTIDSWDELDNEYVSDTITTTGGTQTKDLYLVKRNETNLYTTGRIQPAVIRTLGNKSISLDNPLHVSSIDRRLFLTRRVSGSSYPKYIGYAVPGTPTSTGKWSISYNKSNGEVTWANGNAEFDKVWNSRTGYDYS